LNVSALGVSRAPDTVFFLTDYGLRDEFVGVVHAVLHRLAPQAAVIDISHEVPPHDLRSGAAMLARALPHLGPGVVLAVVDPGVGGKRRCIAVQTRVADEPRANIFVGPDNGLLMEAIDTAGSVELVAEVRRGTTLVRVDPASPSASVSESRHAVTFDGRDVLAPAVAAICNGVPVAELGPTLRADELVRLASPVLELDEHKGRKALRAEVTWIDRFGNAQLAAGPDVLGVGENTLLEPGDSRRVRLEWSGGAGRDERGDGRMIRWVRTFEDLEPAEVGLIVDANLRLALVAPQSSASDLLGLRLGSVVSLEW